MSAAFNSLCDQFLRNWKSLRSSHAHSSIGCDSCEWSEWLSGRIGYQPSWLAAHYWWALSFSAALGSASSAWTSIPSRLGTWRSHTRGWSMRWRWAASPGFQTWMRYSAWTICQSQAYYSRCPCFFALVGTQTFCRGTALLFPWWFVWCKHYDQQYASSVFHFR